MMIHTPDKEADSHSSAVWSAKKLVTEEEKQSTNSSPGEKSYWLKYQ